MTDKFLLLSATDTPSSTPQLSTTRVDKQRVNVTAINDFTADKAEEKSDTQSIVCEEVRTNPLQTQPK